jgi:redox-sensitive bicupin YhaK (pirin superfamily)
MSEERLVEGQVSAMDIVLRQPHTNVVVDRELAYITSAGAPRPGFAGPGHTAIEVFTSDALSHSDPFVLFMDDTLDFLPGQPVGDPHPHAGLETVTLVLEGALDDSSEGLLQAGDMAWMSAGQGVVHNDGTRALGRTRVLQLWLALPRRLRSGAPQLQLIPYWSLPIRRAPGIECRLYCGMTGELSSPTLSNTSCIYTDIMLAPGKSIDQQMPGAFTAFIYVLEGTILVGEDELSAGEVGWLKKIPEAANSAVTMRACEDGARVILCAAQPVAEPLVHHGPFVAGTRQELADYHSGFMEGRFPQIGQISASTSHADG